MSDFFLEIGLEEIPAGFLPSIREQLEREFQERLRESGLPFEGIEVHDTLRRLAVHVAGLVPRQQDREEDVTGPPLAAARDASGAPTKAAIGFAKSKGVSIDECRIIVTAKGEYFGYRRSIKGLTAAELLPQICSRILSALGFPKSMRWGKGEFIFVRPVRWILAVLDGAVLPFAFAGVTSGNRTRLDRTLSSAHVLVSDWSGYQRNLQDAGIVLDAAERRRRIRKALDAEAAVCGGALREDPELLEIVADLIETPLVIHGRFAEDFLELPQEILMTSMREHQKHFSILDAAGRQMPFFLTVADAPADPAGFIRHGNERVLRARLEDARFFWKDDARSTLKDRAGRLDRVIFQQGLGSYADKCGRLEILAARLLTMLPSLDPSLQTPLVTAAQLSKADLTTDMVKEFTSLQGVVGGLYARREGHSESVWKAIYEHYQPISTDDAVPQTDIGCLLSLADRLDTIVGCFGLDRIPSGSRDPLGLRRQAQGVVRICVEKKWNLSLRHALSVALDGYHGQAAFETPREQIVSNLIEFIDGRLRFLFENNYGYDLVNAIMPEEARDPSDMKDRLVALDKFISSGDFLSLATAFKRIMNIIKDQTAGEVSEELFRQEEEKNLYRSFLAVQEKIGPMIDRREYETALAGIATLRTSVDMFFDKVLVMDADARIRSNRIGLLSQMSALFLRIADFSQIDVEERLRNRNHQS